MAVHRAVNSAYVGSTPTSGAMKDKQISPRAFINKSLEEAEKIVEENGLAIRIVMRDGTYHVCTRDFVPHRINLYIENNVVTQAAFG